MIIFFFLEVLDLNESTEEVMKWSGIQSCKYRIRGGGGGGGGGGGHVWD